MARRKRRSVRKSVRKYRRRGSKRWNLKDQLMPIGVATFAEPLIDRYAAQLPIPSIAGLQADDMAKVAIGWYLGKKGGLMGNTAKMIGIFGLRNIVSQFAGRALGGGSNQTDAWTKSQGF